MNQIESIATAQMSQEAYRKLLAEGSAIANLSGINQVNCTECAGQVSEMNYAFNRGLCELCYTRSKFSQGEQATSKESLQKRLERWETLCPELYRKADVSFIDQDKFVKVCRWKYGSQGLMVSGRSRTGKTTSCWHLLQKIYVLEGRSFYAVSEPEFSIIREKSARLNGIDSFLSRCIGCDVFFLDDIGHAATGSKHMEELYYVVEKRTSWKKPIICTTQFTPSEIEERSGRSGNTKTAIAILNRLKSFCYALQF